MRSTLNLFTFFLIAITPTWALAQDATPCVNIYHDQADATDKNGSIQAIMLANLLGHWPKYEVRARPIANYTSADLENCGSTIYLGSNSGTKVPETFLSDYFTSEKRIAWVGFGQHQLDQTKMEAVFKHRVDGTVDLDKGSAKNPAFFQNVSYKDRVFEKSVETYEGEKIGAFAAVRFIPTDGSAKSYVVSELIHNKTYQTTAYILRAGSKFLVGDIPFSYVHEGDRYFVFADLLFDILDEQPLRSAPLAFARTEDIHGKYDTTLLNAVLDTHRSEQVPFSMAHIPMFVDPRNAVGHGAVKIPQPAHKAPDFKAFVQKLLSEPRNAVIWHGVTHQHLGASGDDYEFWQKASNKPIKGESVKWTLDRLISGMDVFEDYGIAPRYWVTPHYQASALNARVFAKAVPWQVGRITYYPSSFGPTFTIPAAGRETAIEMPSITKDGLKSIDPKSVSQVDTRSTDGETQMFPYEIYRDVYGQRIIPETLGYLSYSNGSRIVDHMLADARRHQVIRDCWASFFYHPFVFSTVEDGGIGLVPGDTTELRKLFIGIKMLGYAFTGLDEFESSLRASKERKSARAQ